MYLAVAAAAAGRLVGAEALHQCLKRAQLGSVGSRPLRFAHAAAQLLVAIEDKQPAAQVVVAAAAHVVVCLGVELVPHGSMDLQWEAGQAMAGQGSSIMWNGQRKAGVRVSRCKSQQLPNGTQTVPSTHQLLGWPTARMPHHKQQLPTSSAMASSGARELKRLSRTGWWSWTKVKVMFSM